MNAEEKELLKKLLDEAERKGFSEESVNYIELSNGETNDEKTVNEVRQTMNFLAFTVNILGRKETPPFVKRLIKGLWNRIKSAIADVLRGVACDIDPDCSN